MESISQTAKTFKLPVFTLIFLKFLPGYKTVVCMHPDPTTAKFTGVGLSSWAKVFWIRVIKAY